MIIQLVIDELSEQHRYACFMRKVINRLLDTGPDSFGGSLTTRKYVGMAKVSRATAYREISDLVAKQIFRQNPGRGRSISYDIIWTDTE